jgi:CHC2 zinc finger
MTKDEAKQLVSIPRIWRHFNLPGEPGASCHSPFREDTHPSFSVSSDGQLFNDFGESKGGDAIDFLARVQNTSEFFKVREFIAFAARISGQSVDANPSDPAHHSSQDRVSAPSSVKLADPSKNALKRVLDDSRKLTESECRELGALRSLHPGAFDLAGRLGTLRIGSVCHQKSWILTDARAVCADARRFDGQLYPALGTLKERKTHSPGGSQKDWPVGLLTERPEVNQCRTIVLVEGSADYFAALALIALYGSGDVLPIAKLGAGGSLSTEARVLIGKRRVIIASHDDENRTGARAADTWGSFLERTGADVYLRPCNRTKYGKDLNDMAARFCNDEAKLTQIAHALLE